MCECRSCHLGQVVCRLPSACASLRCVVAIGAAAVESIAHGCGDHPAIAVARCQRAWGTWRSHASTKRHQPRNILEMKTVRLAAKPSSRASLDNECLVGFERGAAPMPPARLLSSYRTPDPVPTLFCVPCRSLKECSPRP